MSDRPNILLITTDQQRFDTIAALGNSFIHTPHLDWLVDEGITFERAYADCPVCGPARATIMTGKCAFTHGMVGNSSTPVLASHATLPKELTRAGYQTRAQGKMHFTPLRAHYGFETMELPMDYYRERNRNARDGLPKEHGVGENEMSPVISTVDEADSLTHWTIRRSIDFLETRDETRPFFMWTSFTKPHPPFDPPANYWALYDRRPVGARALGDWSAELESMPQDFLTSTYSLNNAWRMSEAQLEDSKRAYYACITQIDYQLGLLFARMREMNLLENTWIVFTADHGEMMGDHRMGAKSVHLEGSAHIPMIIRPPQSTYRGQAVRGRRVSELSQLADIMPTVLAAAGVEAPSGMDGVNLLDLLETPVERPFVGRCGGYFCVMEDGFKYLWAQAGGQELLFEVSKDPYEQRELIRTGGYQAQRDALRALLVDAFADCPDIVSGRELIAKAGIGGPGDVPRWPGFHSTVVPTDVLH